MHELTQWLGSRLLDLVLHDLDQVQMCTSRNHWIFSRPPHKTLANVFRARLLLYQLNTSTSLSKRQLQIHTPPPYPFLTFLLLVLDGGSISPPLAFLGVSTTTAVASSLPPTFSSSPGAFFLSTSPISGISAASHCWNGFATKKPSASNHRVNGDDNCLFVSRPAESVVVTVML